MSKFDIYALLLSLIVFVLLVGVFTYLIIVLFKQKLKLIKLGAEDDNIIKQFESDKVKKQNKLVQAIDAIVNTIVCLILVAIFSASIFVSCTQDTYFDNLPTYRVVLTSSMESKHKDNTYLVENNLNNQIAAFDLIATYKLPDEMDLQLYDIVVYEMDNMLIVHRIVGIEEPNATHPNERYFLLQGDAVGAPDRFPVKYSQMKGIYRGTHIPFVGSFVLFMQSPAGWLCLLLIVVVMLILPVLEKRLQTACQQRYELISCVATTTAQACDAQMDVEPQSPTDEQLPDTPSDGDVATDSQGLPLFGKFGQTKTFWQKYQLATEQMQNRYNVIAQTLARIDGVRCIQGKTQHTYKHKSTCIVRLFFRGKTLNVCLALDAKQYENSKYFFTDLSNSNKHKNYPMCMKASSERQTRWICQLILQLATDNGLKVLTAPAEQVVASPFDHLKGRQGKSFHQRLAELPIAKERFDAIDGYICAVGGVRVIRSKKHVTYKLKSLPIAKMTIKGKTLNVYLALKTNDYANSKYVFTDVSTTKKYANYPMRVRASSNRQVKWIKELVSHIVNKGGASND